MKRVSDEQLESCIRWTDGIKLSFVKLQLIHSALTELRERRAADKTPQKTVQEQWCGKDEPIIPDFAQRQVEAWDKEK